MHDASQETPEFIEPQSNPNVATPMTKTFPPRATLRFWVLALALVAGCEGQTLQESVSSTLSALKVDNTAIDDQGKPPLVAREEPAEKPKPKPPTPDQVRFSAYTKTETFSNRLKEAAITNDAYLGRDCATGYTTALLTVLHQPEPPLSMPKEAKHPVAGIWRARYRVKRCGKALVYNAVFGAQPSGAPNMRISTPGTSTAGSELAREMREDMEDTALDLAGMGKCSDKRFVDTRAEPERPDVESNGSTWSAFTREVWTIDVCGRLVDIPLHHGFRDGVGYPQYVFEDVDAPKWRPSGRSVPKDVDLPRLQSALLQVASGKPGASLDYLWAEARREVPFAQTVIAGLLRDGTGLKRDIDRAAFWALRASYGGYPGAMEMVGDLYETGSWIVRDRRLAAAWYRRAAERGSASAKAKLAAMAKPAQAKPAKDKPKASKPKKN